MSHKTHMHGGGESYSGVIPAKQPNKSGRPPAEAVEERPLTKENTAPRKARCRANVRLQCRPGPEFTSWKGFDGGKRPRHFKRKKTGKVSSSIGV